MSFRLFIYYCAMCGGAGAFAGWALGRWLAGSPSVFNSGVKGLFLGLGIAFLLGLLDALWNFSISQFFSIFVRVLMAVVIGSAGGLLGGIVGQLLFDKWAHDFLLVLGWMLTGLLIGMSLGVFDLLAALVRNQETRGPLRKMLNGLIGGTAGGILGGFFYILMDGKLKSFFESKAREDLWTPSSWGFVILGVCIGLLIALAQVILKEAWLKVEAGFRKGREQILTKQSITIGRAERCDVGLFGDAQVDFCHCRIVRKGNDYILTDEGSSTGTYVNDERILGPRDAAIRRPDSAGAIVAALWGTGETRIVGQRSSPRPGTPGRGVGGEGRAAEQCSVPPLTPDPSPRSTGARGEKCGKQKEASCRSTAAADVSASIRGKRCTAITTGCRSTRPGSAGRSPSERSCSMRRSSFPLAALAIPSTSWSWPARTTGREHGTSWRRAISKAFSRPWAGSISPRPCAGPLALPTGIAAWTSCSAHCRTAFGRRPGCKSSRWR